MKISFWEFQWSLLVRKNFTKFSAMMFTFIMIVIYYICVICIIYYILENWKCKL